MEPELTKGLQMMKFAANHPFRFHNRQWGIAWATGLCKVVVIMSVELLNILGLIQKCSMTDSVMGYLRYFIIASFDSFVFNSMNGAPFEEIVKQGNYMLTIDRTTSLKNSWASETYVESLSKADQQEFPCKTLTSKEDMQRKLLLRRHLSFWDRSSVNKLCHLIYRVLKMFYVSFYFYFVPMIIWSLDIFLPLTYQLDEPKNVTEKNYPTQQGPDMDPSAFE